MVSCVTAGYWGAGQPGNQRSDNFAAYKALVDSGISLIDTAEASANMKWMACDAALTVGRLPAGCSSRSDCLRCAAVLVLGTFSSDAAWIMKLTLRLTQRNRSVWASFVCRSKALVLLMGTCLISTSRTQLHQLLPDQGAFAMTSSQQCMQGWEAVRSWGEQPSAAGLSTP